MPGPTVVDNKFIGGLFTDATGLTFPDNSAIETFNFAYQIDGTVERRLGFDLEANFIGQTVISSDYAPGGTSAVFNTYVWKGADGAGLVDLAVVQVGNNLKFFKLTVENAVSNNLTDQLNMATFASGTFVAADIRVIDAQFADGFGRLYVVHPKCNPFYIKYDNTTGLVSGTAITIKVRDLVGVTDDLGVAERPTANSDSHLYNLFNQGWPKSYPTVFGTATIPGGVESAGAAGNYGPSNVDVWWLFRDVDGKFNTASVNNHQYTARGNTPAPKGYFIGEAFNFNRNHTDIINAYNAAATFNFLHPTESLITSNDLRPSCVAFYAGRVFYAGVPHKDFVSNIYASKVIESDKDYGVCYQVNSPTSEELFDLLPTDGLVIKRPEMGTVYKLFPMGTFLIIFASNGVWAISGSQGLGFIATDYSISKISSVPSISGTSFVDVEGMPFWWNRDGIYTVQPSPDGRGLNVSSLTYGHIQNFYDALPPSEKQYVRGAYNPVSKIVQWIYHAATSTTLNERQFYDHILVYNTRTKIFYPYAVADPVHNICIVGIISANLRPTEIVALDTPTAFKYIVRYGAPGSSSVDMSFALEKDEDYVDWSGFVTNGVSYADTSYFITGFRVYTEGNKLGQVPYIWVHAKGPSKVDIQLLWDYANSGDYGDWSNKQRIEFDGRGKLYQTKPRRIRGDGKALQIKFSAVDGNPATLIGWSAQVAVNKQP